MAVTHRDLAEKLGVNVSTVSRALSGHPHISAALREQVEATARAMGYRPNPYVSALMASRRKREAKDLRGILGLIEPRPESDSPPLVETKIGREIVARAQHHGFSIDTIHTSGKSARDLARLIRAHNIAGAIVARTPLDGAKMPLPWDLLSCACAGVVLREPRLHAALSHDAHSVRMILNAARELGYERVGLAISLESSRLLDHGWIAGYLVDAQMRGAPGGLPLCLSPGGDRAFFRNWLAKHRPDAIISNHHDFLNELTRLSYEMPNEVGWIHLSQACPHEGMAHIHHRIDRVAAAAVDLVVGNVFHNERGLPGAPVTILVEYEFVPGWSLPDRRRLRN